MNNAISRLVKLVFVLLVISLLNIVSSNKYPAAISIFSAGDVEAESNELMPTTNNDLIGGIIILRSASGKSYMADRDFIATMPELKTQEEVKAFVESYKHSDQDATIASKELRNAGFIIVAQDDIFIVVSGSALMYESFFPSISIEELKNISSGSIVHDAAQNIQETSLGLLIDGLIIPSSSDSISSMTMENGSFSSPNPKLPAKELQSTVYADYGIIRDALKLGPPHALGIRGEGVRVGFIDEGVFSGHPFFSAYPATIRYLKYSSTGIEHVINNFNPKHNSSHGTTVASYLVNSAPDAKFYSMAIPTPDDDYSGNFFLGYLTYINQYHLIDILSISQAIYEEVPGVMEGYIVDIRMAFLNFISQGGVVLVGGGNYGQAIGDDIIYDSGHSAFAAIPEVIAVGGSTLVPVGPTYIFNAAEGASSFSSILFPGRHVPDVVSVYGPAKSAENDGSYGIVSGTSLATPQLAGMVALLKGTIPDLTQEMAKTILENNSFDITSGSSGDGDSAGVGYDLATGYGQPLATWVLNAKEVLYPGWNFIGLTTSYDYTAETLLRHIQFQGGDCDIVSVWDSSIQGYEGLIIDDGNVFGSDFDISPEEAVWIRCHNKVYWTPSGNYKDTLTPIQMTPGWNAINGPYVGGFCFASDIYHETGGVCWQVADYDSKFNVYVNKNGHEYGENLYLSTGKGFFVRCNADIIWTPDCTGSIGIAQLENRASPENIFSAVSFPDKGPAILAEGDLASDSELQSTNCAISNVWHSNNTHNSFSLSWTTQDPCPGSLLVNNGSGTIFRAFDDRGLQYTGTTHHISVRGLEPNNTYSYQIVSGDVFGTGSPITTGANLDYQPSTKYSAKGIVVGDDFTYSPNAIVYAWLTDNSGHSSRTLSFSLSQITDGFSFVLGNMRTLDGNSYFLENYTGTQLNIKVQGGSAGYSQFIVPLTLSTNHEVEVGTTILDAIPAKSIVIYPTGPILENQPTFKFFADGTNTEKQYRLELSRDNFDSIEFVFDQRMDKSGWSKSGYGPAELAKFTIPIALENLVAYQWRVMAYDVDYQTWGSASRVTGFSIGLGFNYLPMLFR